MSAKAEFLSIAESGMPLILQEWDPCVEEYGSPDLFAVVACASDSDHVDVFIVPREEASEVLAPPYPKEIRDEIVSHRYAPGIRPIVVVSQEHGSAVIMATRKAMQ